MKRFFLLLLTTVVLAGILGGCSQKNADTFFTAENEIYTYDKVDPERTQIVVSSLGNNADIRSLAAAFEAQNPDIQVICIDLTGGTTDYRPVADWVSHGMAPDVMFVNHNSFTDSAMIAKYFEDFSANLVIENFEAAALNQFAVDGFAYFLPAPSELNCILYNKTLFDQYGWEVPTSFDEFVALCLQIREDTDGTVQPWNPNAKYDSVFSTALEAFTYEELFGGVDNWSWYNDFCQGQATFAGHMEPFFAMLQTLIDNDILREEHFDYSATTRLEDFTAGRLAMFNAPISSITSDEYVFDYMPYPTTVGETGYVNNYYSALLCVPIKEHGDVEQDAIDRYIDFFSSVDGQQALIGETMMVSNVKDVPANDSDAMAGIQDVVDQGHLFSYLDFYGPAKPTWTFRDSASSMLTEGKTGAEIIAEIDADPYATPQDSAELPSPIATVTEDLSILEFSCYIADMYRETAGAEIGLINHGIAYRGNLVRLFTGDIYESYMFPVKPRSFANDSTLVKVSMTGQQLLDALNNPLGYNCVSDSVYAFSGLQCEVAPWNELGSKYLSVKLADGSELKTDKLYTVAIWDGTVAEEYITEKLASCEGSWEELMSAKMQTDGTIAPANDGRITLIWE